MICYYNVLPPYLVHMVGYKPRALGPLFKLSKGDLPDYAYSNLYILKQFCPVSQS